MEPDASIDTSSMIRVAVLPIGDVPAAAMREYWSMLGRHASVPLSATSSFYAEHQKSPFAHQPWDSGCLRFRFVLGGAPPSPWEDFQSNRKILAVVGLCHCPSSPDLAAVADRFASDCKPYSSSVVRRCFAFSPNDDQVCFVVLRSRECLSFLLAKCSISRLFLLLVVCDPRLIIDEIISFKQRTIRKFSV